MILDCNLIKVLVIHTKPPSSIFLMDQQSRGRKKAQGGANNAGNEHVLHLTFKFHFLSMGITIEENIDWMCAQ